MKNNTPKHTQKYVMDDLDKAICRGLQIANHGALFVDDFDEQETQDFEASLNDETFEEGLPPEASAEGREG